MHKPARTRLGIAVLFTVGTLFAADSKLTPEMQAIADRINVDSLRGHLSFIASDALEGRLTPSRGLDIAAEYIAAQFRRAGLEPVADDGYFQTAKVIVREQNPEGFDFTVTAGGKTLKLAPGDAMILLDKPLALDDVPVTFTNGTIHIGELALRRSLDPRRTEVIDAETPRPARDVVFSQELFNLMRNATDARATVHIAPMIERTAVVRNVAGVLRGLDDQYVMLTAHYDHVGTRTTGDDKIYNGANDDGSGTVSVIEIASAFAAQKTRPKHSILFVTFFGEELGDVGSHFYARHPLVPLGNTIADLNLEQVGRTDDSDGPQINMATVTGFDFSTMTKTLVEAGELTGLKVYSRKEGDQYFLQSDNAALAQAGVPAHTMGVAFGFPDYHDVGDEWQKIDYANMAKVDRTVAIGLWQLANAATVPEWNSANPKTKRYVEAAQKLHAH